MSIAACENKENDVKPKEYSITFDANGGAGEMLPQSFIENTTIALKENTFTRTGYAFEGWALNQTGIVTYTDRADITAGASDMALFAVWNANTYIISFNANGGNGGKTTSVTAAFGSAMPALGAAAPEKANHDFLGYFDTTTGGTMYYNADLSPAKNWDKAENTTLYAGWQDNSTPVYDNTSSTVSLVQSTTITNVTQHTYASIKTMVDEAIRLAGGLEDIVKFGDTVVLKPNIITTVYGWQWPFGVGIPSGAPDATTPTAPNGIVTDWRVVQAVAENVRAIIGAKGSPGAGRILVMESSGKGSPENGTMDHYANVNYNMVNLSAVDELLTLDAVGGDYWYSIPPVLPGDVLKVQLDNPVLTVPHDQFYDGQGNYYVAKQMYEADALICIPVLKLHTTAGTTGAIKNISIGATPPRVYGNSSYDIGRNNRIPHTEYNGIHKWIADYYAVMPADFVIMEALQGVDQGPLPPAGDPSALKRLNSVLASRDGLAIDVVMSNIIKVDYTRVGHLAYLTERGEVGTKPGKRLTVRGNPNAITVVGNKKVHDLRDGVNFSGSITTGLNGNISSTRLSAQQLAKPAVTIASAQFTGDNLNLNLNVSSNTVKVDVYIDNQYISSVNGNLSTIVIDASTITTQTEFAVSHTITVYAYTNYMAYEETSVTVTH